jgi:capsid assembly protease
LFVQAIAKNRGVSVDTVLQDMADGRLFIGEQAISAGLVDGVSTLDALIVKLNQDRTRSTSTRASAKPRPAAAGVANAAQPTPIPVSKGKDMPSTREQLAAESPELLSSLLAEGADQERTRIQAVEGQLIRGHEALIQTLKFDGKSTAGDAAMAVLAAERNTRNAAAQALASDAPAAIALKPIASVEKTALTRADIDTAAKAHMAANPGTDYIAAVKHVQAQHAQA